MSEASIASPQWNPDHLARRALLALVVLTPWFFIHARVVGEVVIAGLAIFAILRITVHAEWHALRRAWMALALGYWAWLSITTALGDPARADILLALAWIRFPLAALALAVWILVDARARLLLAVSLALACLWIAVEVWLQALIGRGLSGPSADVPGILTGPFTWARAGPFLAVAIWPGLVLAHERLRQSGTFSGQAVGMAVFLSLLLMALGALVFTGQRMPVLQAAAIVAVAAALLPSLRRPAMFGILAMTGLLMLTPLVASGAFHRLVIEMPQQIASFPGGPYGEVWGFWLETARERLWTGFGHLAWRDAVCPNGSTGCHPHSHYLQVLLEAGLPGLFLFVGMSSFALWSAITAWWADRDPIRLGAWLGLLAAGISVPALKAMTVMPQIGLIVLLAGLALGRTIGADSMDGCIASRPQDKR